MLSALHRTACRVQWSSNLNDRSCDIGKHWFATNESLPIIAAGFERWDCRIQCVDAKAGEDTIIRPFMHGATPSTQWRVTTGCAGNSYPTEREWSYWRIIDETRMSLGVLPITMKNASQDWPNRGPSRCPQPGKTDDIACRSRRGSG